MPENPHVRHRVAERDAAQRRLRTTTRLFVVGATALAGVFAGLAAQKATAKKATPPATTTTAATRSRRIPPPPSLGAAPAPPASAPLATSAPPVAVSGGS